MEASTRESTGNEPDTGGEAVRAAARGKVNPETADAATEWFLSDEEPLHKTVEINVGSEDEERWIPWVVRPIDLEVLRRIRRQSANTSRRGGPEGVDEIQANLQIVVAGTVSPDLKALAKQRGVPAPEELLRLRFVQKPGLLGNLASEILTLSGYDDASLRDPTVVGN